MKDDPLARLQLDIPPAAQPLISWIFNHPFLSAGGVMLVWVLIIVLLPDSKAARQEREASERKAAEAERIRLAELRTSAIEVERRSCEDAALRAAIFAVTTDSGLNGYHLKELGWVDCETEDRSIAEHELKLKAARAFTDPKSLPNALSKLTASFVAQEYVDGERPDGSPRLRS